MATVDVYTGIHDHLVGDVSAGSFGEAIVTDGGDVWHGIAAQDTAGPYAIFALLSNAPVRYLADDDLEADFTIIVYGPKDSASSATAKDVIDIQDKLITRLDRASVTLSNHTGVQAWALDYGAPQWDGERWSIASDWRIAGTSS
jgi:hypothetical protein